MPPAKTQSSQLVEAVMESSKVLKLSKTTQVKRRHAIAIFISFLDSYQNGLGHLFAYGKTCAGFDDLELWRAAIRFIMIPRKRANPLAYSTVSCMFFDIITSVQAHTTFRISDWDRSLLRKYISQLIDLRPKPLKLPFATEDFQRIVLMSYAPSVHFETAAHRIQFAALLLLIAFCGGRPGEFLRDDRITPEESRALQWKNVSFYVGVGLSGETIFQALVNFENLKSRTGSRKRMPLYEEQGTDNSNHPYLDPLWPLLALGIHDGVFKYINSVEDLQGISARGILNRDQGSIRLAIKEECLDDYVFRLNRPAKSSEAVSSNPLTFSRGNETLKRVSKACCFRDPLQFYDFRRFVGGALEMALVTPSDRTLIFGHAANSRTFDIAYKNSTSAIDLQSISQSRSPDPASVQVEIVRARYEGPLSPEQRRRIAYRVSQDSRVMIAQKAVHCAKPSPGKKLLHTLSYVRRLAREVETRVERVREDEEVTKRIIRGEDSPRTAQSPSGSSSGRSRVSTTPECSTRYSISTQSSLSPTPSSPLSSPSQASPSSASTSGYRKRCFVEKAIDPASVDEASEQRIHRVTLAAHAAAITPVSRSLPDKGPSYDIFDVFCRETGIRQSRFNVINLMMAMLAEDNGPKLAPQRQIECPVCDTKILGHNALKVQHIRACTRNDLYTKYTSHASFRALYGDSRPTRVSDLIEYCLDCEEWFIGHSARVAHKLKHASKPPSDLDTRYFCPFCLYDDDEGKTTWRLCNESATRRHINSQHILHKKCATKCPYPECSFPGSGLDLALHLTDCHRVSLFGPSREGRSRMDLDLDPLTKLGGCKKPRQPARRSLEEYVSINTAVRRKRASEFELVLPRLSPQELSTYTRLD